MGRLDMSIDHIQPRSKGGSNHKSNLWLTHVSCNTHRQSNPLELFPIFIKDPIGECSSCKYQTDGDSTEDHFGRWFMIDGKEILLGAYCIPKAPGKGPFSRNIISKCLRRTTSVEQRYCFVCSENKHPVSITKAVRFDNSGPPSIDQFCLIHTQCWREIGSPGLMALVKAQNSLVSA